MGKPFTDKEHEKIIKELKLSGRRLSTVKGFKKVSIDEIVTEVGISKGQFYNYYKSKEEFLFEVREDVEKEIHNYMILKLTKKDINREYIINTFCEIFKMINEPRYKVFFDYNEIQYLLKKLSAKKKNQDLKKDVMVVDKIIGFAVKDKELNQYQLKKLTGIIRSIFLILGDRDVIGEDVFDDVVKYHVTNLIDYINVI